VGIVDGHPADSQKTQVALSLQFTANWPAAGVCVLLPV
jgi:hypothetical protein